MSKAMKHLLLGGLMALSVLFPIQSMAGDTLSRVVDFQVLKVGMSGAQPPLNTRNRDGNLMGFDVDLAKAMAAAMRVELEIKTMPFGELMTALEKDEIQIVVQVNGKLRGRVSVSAGADSSTIEEAALNEPNVQRFIADTTIRRIIVVPGRLVNIVC